MVDEQHDPRDVYENLGQRWVRACDNPIGGSAYIGAAVVGLLVFAVVPPAVQGNLFAFGFGIYILANVWLFLRAARMGVYINRDGVLLRRFWSPKIEFDWDAVDRFEVARRTRKGAEVDQVRLVASGAEFWLPLVIRNVGQRGLHQDVDDVAKFLGDIRDEATVSFD